MQRLSLQAHVLVGPPAHPRKLVDTHSASSHAPTAAPPGTWAPARRAAHVLASPIQRILAVEAASGILLMAATVLALVWANSGWAASYEALWHTPLGFRIGELAFERPLHFWINDGLMTIFFLVVGLEIRREVFEGELQSLRRASLPLAAALGGMVVPAIIYALLNHGGVGAAGWAIPMATDIAFAVGVLTLLGSRVPNSLRVLLLALAVIDDIGAIVVIAAFYSGGIQASGIGIAAIGIGAVIALRAAGVRPPIAYLIPGIVVWSGMYGAGIHPTLAGVILGLLTPARPWFGPSGFAATTQAHLEKLGDGDKHELLKRLDEINQARREAVSPTERLIHALHPWVAYGVMPLFALANAGVVLGGAQLSGGGLWVFVGVIAGLALGKPLGIITASLLTSKLGLATRSEGATLGGLSLVGIVGGIGFTMSLFIAQLAFPPGTLLDTAKLGILVGSATAMLGGLAYGRMTFRQPTT
ncbi:MAG: Na+/H+ antiporter NhaA [Kofleriaceae bacterium]|nr:Na+/H+ antiporter NhaA [Kofleriaceae bacterium]